MRDIDINEINDIVDNLSVRSGDVVDFLSMVDIGFEVAKYYKLDFAIKNINDFYTDFMGRPLTLQTGVIFWIYMFNPNPPVFILHDKFEEKEWRKKLIEVAEKFGEALRRLADDEDNSESSEN